MANKYYTGIGSRKTPQHVLNLMTRVANKLESLGYILRSGGAVGADSAFERGVSNASHKQIFLASDSTPEAEQLASTIHPAWYRCSDYSRKLHGRNCFQVLGKDLKTKSLFVLCWTQDALPKGGTATAIRLAQQNGIPVYNLANSKVYERLTAFVNK